MNIEQQNQYLSIIKEDFETMTKMLNEIRDNITEYPVYTQLAFVRPLKNMVFEAWQDSVNKNDTFLNNFIGGDDSITV